MHAGRESDHNAIVDRDRDMVTGVCEELSRQSRIDRTIEDAVCDPCEDRLVART